MRNEQRPWEVEMPPLPPPLPAGPFSSSTSSAFFALTPSSTTSSSATSGFSSATKTSFSSYSPILSDFHSSFPSSSASPAPIPPSSPSLAPVLSTSAFSTPYSLSNPPPTTDRTTPFSPVSLLPSPRFSFTPSFSPLTFSSSSSSSSPSSSPSPTASPSPSPSPSPIHFSASQPLVAAYSYSSAQSTNSSAPFSFSPFSTQSTTQSINQSGTNTFPFPFNPPSFPNIPSLIISPRSCAVSPASLVSLSPHPSPSSLSHSFSSLLSLHPGSSSSCACPSPPSASLNSSPTNSPTTSRAASPTASPSSSIIRGKDTKRGRPRQMTCVFCYLRHSTCHQTNCVSYATFGRWTDEQYKKYLPIWIQWGPKLFYPKGVKRVKANQIRDVAQFRKRIDEALEEIDVVRRGVKEDQIEEGAPRGSHCDDKPRGLEMDCDGETEEWAGAREWESPGSGIRREWAGGSGVRRADSGGIGSGSGIGFTFGFGVGSSTSGSGSASGSGISRNSGGSGILRTAGGSVILRGSGGGHGILRDEGVMTGVRGGSAIIRNVTSRGGSVREHDIPARGVEGRSDAAVGGGESVVAASAARERTKGGSGIKREGREAMEINEEVSNKKLHVSYLLHD